MKGESVFLLWYVQPQDGDSADLLIGVYRTEEDAKAASDQLKTKAGFVAAPEGFRINRYELNRDHFTGGTDGGNAEGGLVMDSNGNLYATTYQGGLSSCAFCVVVFEITP
jgi:hypothetical protein